jgi:cystathionine beta-lyase
MTDEAPSTKATALGRMSKEHFGAVNTPVYRASTILFPDMECLKTGRAP